MADDDFTPLPTQPPPSVGGSDDFTPVQHQPAATEPAPGAEGRQITVHPRGKPLPPTVAPPVSTTEDIAKSAGSGLIQGTEGLVGLPGDLAHGADYGLLWAETHAGEKLGLLPEGETADSLMKKYRGSAMRAMLSGSGVPSSALDTAAKAYDVATPTTPDVAEFGQKLGVPSYNPQTTPGRYAQTIASFIPGTVAAPESGAMDVLKGVYGAGSKLLAKNIATQAVIPAVGSETAGYATQGTPLEPYARFLGALGPGIASTATKIITRPMTAAGQLEHAQQTFTGLASDPYAVQRQLAVFRGMQVPGAGMGEIIPGSKPMTGALTGDLGLIDATRRSMTDDSALYHANPYGTGVDQQNAARVAALRNIQPTGNPEAVADTIKNTHQEIEGEHTAAVQQAFDKARSMAPSSAKTPEALGEALRQPLVKARNTARARESSLWNAIDPTGHLALPTAPVRSGARGISRGIEHTAKPMGGEESSIFHAARSLPRVAKFSDIRALSSRAGEEMRNQLVANGGQPNVAYRRLSMLKSRIDSTIANGAQSVAKFQARAARAKMMPKEATIGANLERDAAEFKIRRANAARAGEEGVSGDGGGGSSAVSGLRGTTEYAPRGLPGSVRPTSIPEPLIPSFDEGAADRLAAARSASSERFRTFDRGPIAATIKTAPTTSEFKMPASAVPGKVFKSGPGGYEAAQAYAKAVGKPYLDPFLDAATESLSREAVSDGMVDPKAFARWQEKNSEAIRALPGPVRDRFANAASATEAYQEALSARKAALDGFQKSRVGAFLGLHDPEDVTKAVGSIFGRQDAVGRMRDLAQTIAHDPNAVQGLRKSIADFLVRKATSTIEAGTSGEAKLNPATFQNLLRDNRSALIAAGFSEPEVAAMQAIGEDIKRSQRTLQATKLEGQSNTAQDMAKRMEEHSAHKPMTLFQKIFVGYEALKEAHEFMGVKGAALAATAGMAKYLVSSLRNAGIKTSDDLVREALLNPEMAQKLIRPDLPSTETELAKTLGKHALFSFMGAQRTGLQ